MTPPFSVDEFFGVFATYNGAVWPAQVGLALLGIAAVVLALRGGEAAGRGTNSILAFLWLWMAVVYHWTFFAEVNPAARVFAGGFTVQALLFGWLAWRPSTLQFRPRLDRYGVAGGMLIVYALVVYPALSHLMGHAYPAQPTFGLPCPTTIFTLGLLLWAGTRAPWGVLVVPVAWSLVGASAVRYFGVVEDAMLPVAGIFAVVLLVSRKREGRDEVAATPRERALSAR